MTTSQADFERSIPVAWPLAASVLLTTVVVAAVCVPPPTPLHSWMQIVSRATLYLLLAGCVHALAVWGVCRVREESEDADVSLIWGVIWAAWIVVVWLPLVALLTAERSVWVAMALPITVVFATMLVIRRAMREEVGEDLDGHGAVALEPFRLLEAPPLWRLLLPAVVTSVAAQLGIAMLVAGHGWIAGCMFGAGMVYPLSKWLERGNVFGRKAREGWWGRTATGNSVTVWLLLVLALVPFLATYMNGMLSGILGVQAHAVSSRALPSLAYSKAKGYDSIILVQPKKPHTIAAPTMLGMSGTVTPTNVIPFDGAYWYFKQPDTQPARDALVIKGDPAKKHIHSTDEEPLVMEAHQPLGREIALNCCRSLRLDVSNADSVAGKIAVEVLLRDTATAKTVRVSLGSLVLASSTVSPMPLKRPAVDDRLIFQIPRAARGKSFNEITVRIKPEDARSLAGPQVAIKDFVLQP